MNDRKIDLWHCFDLTDWWYIRKKKIQLKIWKYGHRLFGVLTEVFSGRQACSCRSYVSEIKVADQTSCLYRSQYTNIRSTSPGTDPIILGARWGSHWSTSFKVLVMFNLEKDPRESWNWTQVRCCVDTVQCSMWTIVMLTEVRMPVQHELPREQTVVLTFFNAVCELLPCWQSPERLRSMNYQEKLETTSSRINAKFIDYRPETGSWVFEVCHWSLLYYQTLLADLCTCSLYLWLLVFWIYVGHCLHIR